MVHCFPEPSMCFWFLSTHLAQCPSLQKVYLQRYPYMEFLKSVSVLAPNSEHDLLGIFHLAPQQPNSVTSRSSRIYLLLSLSP